MDALTFHTLLNDLVLASRALVVLAHLDVKRNTLRPRVVRGLGTHTNHALNRLGYYLNCRLTVLECHARRTVTSRYVFNFLARLQARIKDNAGTKRNGHIGIHWAGLACTDADYRVLRIAQALGGFNWFTCYTVLDSTSRRHPLFTKLTLVDNLGALRQCRVFNHRCLEWNNSLGDVHDRGFPAARAVLDDARGWLSAIFLGGCYWLTTLSGELGLVGGGTILSSLNLAGFAGFEILVLLELSRIRQWNLPA